MATAYDTLMASLAPTGWWPLNDPAGSSVAADASGNGHPASVVGSVTFGETSTPAAGNTSVLINGGSYGNNGLLSDLTVPSATTLLTANIWLFIPTWTGSTYYPVPFASATTSTSNYGFYLNGTLSSTAGKTAVQYVVGNGSSVVGPTAHPSPGAWHMFTLAYDGSGVQGYLDGVSVGSPQAITADWGTGDVALGYAPGDAGDYVSYIAEGAVWVGTRLSGTQIANLYAAASETTYTAAAAVTVDAAATGESYLPATGVAAVTVDGAAHGAPSIPGTGIASIAVTASGDGAVLPVGGATGTATITVVADANGHAYLPGAGLATLTVVGSATPFRRPTITFPTVATLVETGAVATLVETGAVATLVETGAVATLVAPATAATIQTANLGG